MKRNAKEHALIRSALIWPTIAFLTIVTAISGVVYLPVPVVDYILEQDLRERSELWERRVVMHLEDVHETFHEGVLTPAEHEFLSVLPEASDVYRFKLYQADGTLFWSTRSSDLSGHTEKNPHLLTLAQNKSIYHHEGLSAHEIEGLHLHAHDTNVETTHEVAELHVPIIHHGEFLGAIEFYSDITDIRNLFIARVHMTLIVLSIAAVCVMVTVAIVISRANRARYNALEVRSESERNLMDQQLHLAQEVKLLGELNEWLQSSRSLDELFDMVIKFMRHMLPECAGSIYVYSNSRDVLDGVSSWNDGALKRHIHPEACWGLRRGRTYTYGTSEVDFVCEHAEPHDETPYFCFPILAHGETVGLMHLKKRPDVNVEAFLAARKLAQMCAEQISMAIANVRMRDQLQEQSIRDPLTGLFNRRHMIDRLRHLVDLSGRSSRKVHVIYLDLDHFKRFNDTHGHDAGDFVLRAVGEVLDASCSNDEVACRMGGEEFVVLWPDVSEADLKTRLSALCRKISGLSLSYQGKTLPKITASVGVANTPDHGNLPQDVLRAADEAMYLAKHNGRDQVIFAGQGAETTSGTSSKGKALHGSDHSATESAKIPSVAAE